MKNSICSREPIVLDSKCHNPTSTGTTSSRLTLPFRYLGLHLPFVVNSQISHIKYGIYIWAFSWGLDFWIFCVSFMKELNKSDSKKRYVWNGLYASQEFSVLSKMESMLPMKLIFFHIFGCVQFLSSPLTFVSILHLCPSVSPVFPYLTFHSFPSLPPHTSWLHFPKCIPLYLSAISTATCWFFFL